MTSDEEKAWIRGAAWALAEIEDSAPGGAK